MLGRRIATARTALSTVLAAGLCLAAMTAVSAAGSPTPERLRDGFFKVVFGLEYGRGHGDSQRVKKFSDPVRFHIINLGQPDRSATVKEFVAALPEKVGGIRSRLVNDPQSANFRIFLVERHDFAQTVARELRADAVAMNARCLVGVRTRNGRILSSTAVIVVDDPYLFQRCMVEEILQGLGPMNDNATLTDSVFNDSSRHTDFTSFDLGLMRMLYHPAIRPGMTGSEVHQLLPQVFVDLGYYR
ncbi:DUF2927 domain-containing protein [Amorphus sp. MBR-141]